MKNLMVGLVLALSLVGCSKKSPSGTGVTESLEVVSVPGYWAYPIQTYQSATYTTIRGAWVKFNAQAGKGCLVDSLIVYFPDSYGNRLNCKKTGWGMLVTGGEKGDLGEFPICGDPYLSCFSQNLAAHGKYQIMVWGTWDNTVHQSAVYEWTW